MKKLLVLILFTFVSISMMAQVTTSSIRGKITDNNNDPLPGATIVATHIPSGTQYFVVADFHGNYCLMNIRPGGPYSIEVRFVGYQTSIIKGVSALLGETLFMNVHMKDYSQANNMEKTLNQSAYNQLNY